MENNKEGSAFYQRASGWSDHYLLQDLEIVVKQISQFFHSRECIGHNTHKTGYINADISQPQWPSRLQLIAAARSIIYRSHSCIFPSLLKDQDQSVWSRSTGSGVVACHLCPGLKATVV